MQADSITSAAARAITGLTAQGLRDAVERGELQAERLSPRVLVYSRRDVETWAARRAGTAAAREVARRAAELDAARKAGGRASVAAGRWYSSRDLRRLVDSSAGDPHTPDDQ